MGGRGGAAEQSMQVVLLQAAKECGRVFVGAVMDTVYHTATPRFGHNSVQFPVASSHPVEIDHLLPTCTSPLKQMNDKMYDA